MSADGRRILTEHADQSLALWNAQTGELLRSIPTPNALEAAHMSANAELVAVAGTDHVVDVIRTVDGATAARLAGHTAFVEWIQVSEDAKVVVTASTDRTARLWDARSGAQLARFDHDVEVNAAWISPDKNVVATISGGALRIWDAHGGRLLEVEDAADEAGDGGVVISPNGRVLVTSSTRGVLKLWSLPSWTGTLEELDATLACRVPLLLDRGRLVSTTLDSSKCARP